MTDSRIRLHRSLSNDFVFHQFQETLIRKLFKPTDRPNRKQYGSNLLVLLFLTFTPTVFDEPKITRMSELVPICTHNLPADGNFSVRTSVGSNTTVNVLAGGSIGDNFSAGSFAKSSTDIVVNIAGGTVGDSSIAFSGSSINISSGTIGTSFLVHGSELNVFGGTVGKGLRAFNGSEVNIFDGTIGKGFSALNGSEVNILGGQISDSFSATIGSKVTISGGTFEGDFIALSGSNVILVGTNFELDGVSIDDLKLGQPYTITERDVRLTCRLADGKSFSLDLNSTVGYSTRSYGDYFSRSATISVKPIANVQPKPSNMVFLFVVSGVALLGVLVARNAIAVWGKAILPSKR